MAPSPPFEKILATPPRTSLLFSQLIFSEKKFWSPIFPFRHFLSPYLFYSPLIRSPKNILDKKQPMRSTTLIYYMQNNNINLFFILQFRS